MIYFTPKHPLGVQCDRWFCYSSRKLNLPAGFIFGGQASKYSATRSGGNSLHFDKDGQQRPVYDTDRLDKATSRAADDATTSKDVELRPNPCPPLNLILFLHKILL